MVRGRSLRMLLWLVCLPAMGVSWNFINPNPEHQKVMAVHRQKVLKLGKKMRATSANKSASEKVSNPWNKHLVQSSLVHELYTEVMKVDTEKRDFDVSCIKSMSGELREPSSFNEAVRAHVAEHGLFSGHADVRVDSGRWGRGALATKSFEPGDAVGQYVGNEWLDFEFAALYPENAIEWYYSMHVSYMSHAKQGTYRKKHFFKPSKQGVPIPKDVEIVVDGCADHTRRGTSAIAFVNDCRLNISDASMTMEDRTKRRNVEFIYCAVDGTAVFPFLVVTAHINRGDELLTYYGPAYTLDDSQLNASNTFASQFAAHTSSLDDPPTTTTATTQRDDEDGRLHEASSPLVNPVQQDESSSRDEL